MKIIKHYPWSLIIALIICFPVKGQKISKGEFIRPWEIGVNGGGANFLGEYNISGHAFLQHFNQWHPDLRPAYGGYVRKSLNQNFGLELNWTHSNISGTWKYPRLSIPNYRTQVIETDINTVWNFSNLLYGNRPERKLLWYGKLGLGISHLWRREGLNLLLHNNQWKFTIPVSTELSYQFSKRFNFKVGTALSKVQTDRLDGVETSVITGQNRNYEREIFGGKLYTYAGFGFRFGKREDKAEVIRQTPVIPIIKPTPAPEPTPPPTPKPTVVQKPIVIPENKPVENDFKVHFAFNCSALTSESKRELERLIKALDLNQKFQIKIEAHSDCIGEASYNLKLSEARGKIVRDYLMNGKIPGSYITISFFGETQPLNKCIDGVACTKVEHAQNRIVILRVYQ